MLPFLRAVQTPSRGVVFEHVQNNCRRMAFYTMAQREHSVAGDCTALNSAIGIFLERC